MMEIKTIYRNFLFTSIVVIVGLFATVTCSGFVWGRNFTFQSIGLVIAGLIILGYLIWRTGRREHSFIRLRIEWILGLCVFALLLSWFLSPNMRIGLERIGTFLGYILVFYIFLDALDANFNRWSIIFGMLLFSGIYLFSAAAEIYLVYRQWFIMVGNILPPFIYRFTSFMGHANGLMAFVNLSAPLAFTVFIHRKRLIEKFGAGLWLGLYIIVVPFSSSRGGWLGMSAWVAVVFILWFIDKGIWGKIRDWLNEKKKSKWVFIFLAVILVAVFIIGAIYFWYFFASHPSHGSNIFGGRGTIWGHALAIWEESPWVGAGPGRYAFEYLDAARNIPPEFWALNGHGLFTQILGEFGSIGLLSLIILIIGAIVVLTQKYKKTSPALRVWSGAMLGGCASWIVHGTFEELLYIPSIVPLLLLIAWVVTASDTSLDRWNDLNLRIIWVPIALLVAGVIRNHWAYSPLAQAVENTEWTSRHRAEAMEISLARDPNNFFYATQTAMMWSDVWNETEDRAALSRSITLFKFANKLEPSYSPNWANLAILERNNLEYETAIEDLHKAMALTQNEGTFALNVGYIYEQRDMLEEAVKYYQIALKSNPKWATLPFWDLNNIRKQALSSWMIDIDDGVTYESSKTNWQLAVDSVSEGDFVTAERLISTANWLAESNEGVLYARGRLNEAQGNGEAAVGYYEQILQSVKTNWRSYGVMARSLEGIFFRDGLDTDLASGYVRLFEDSRQLDALNRLANLYQLTGKCEEMRQALVQRDLLIGGGFPTSTLKIPNCP